jgi:uncharacterized protein (DUF305 family)
LKRNDLMARRTLVCVALLGLATVAVCQQTTPPPTVVQPGAPGKSSKILPPSTRSAPLNVPTVADIAFMRGMIMHHNQAVEMTGLMTARTQNPELLNLGKRISISQTDEMGFMKRWLADRGIPITDPAMDKMMKDMPDMDMSAMMPGMLSPGQMDALRKATGPRFDHLFLTGMIQHHSGALKMVKDLFATPGAAQDALLFDFTSDVTNSQQAEIDIMRHMLAKEKQ